MIHRLARPRPAVASSTAGRAPWRGSRQIAFGWRLGSIHARTSTRTRNAREARPHRAARSARWASRARHATPPPRNEAARGTKNTGHVAICVAMHGAPHRQLRGTDARRRAQTALRGNGQRDGAGPGERSCVCGGRPPRADKGARWHDGGTTLAGGNGARKGSG